MNKTSLEESLLVLQHEERVHMLSAPHVVEVRFILVSSIALSDYHGECSQVPLHAGMLHTAPQLPVDLGQRGENVAVLL